MILQVGFPPLGPIQVLVLRLGAFDLDGAVREDLVEATQRGSWAPLFCFWLLKSWFSI